MNDNNFVAIVCSGDKDGKCDMMGCAHKGIHEYMSGCILTCHRGELKHVCHGLDHLLGIEEEKIMDVDELFEEVDI